MNAKHIFLFGCAGFFASGIANAFAADPPLFAAFKQFCAETQAKPDAVKAAVTAAHGKKIGKASTGNNAPVEGGGNSWGLVYQGHHLTISSGTLQAPAVGNTPATTTVTCAITDSNGDNKAAGAISTWAAVPPSAQIAGSAFGTYTYKDENGTHAPVKAAETALKNPEGMWNLTITHFGNWTAVNLAHVTAASQ